MSWLDILSANKSCLLICFVFITLVASVGIFSAYGVPSSANPSTFFAGSTPYGVPYNIWLEKWWQWNMQIPKEHHPETNSNVTKCPVGESGNVSFLTQSLQGGSQYSCTIPAGHAILIPISPGECTTDEAHSSVPADMVKCAAEGNKYLTFDASVDGVHLNGLEQNNAITGVFNMTVPKDNFLDLKPGQWNDAAAGYWAFLKPLPVGDHRVSIAARVTNPIDPSYNYDYHTVYLLKVQ
jgi:hypothetical protein